MARQNQTSDAQAELLLLFFQRQMEAGKWLLGSLLVVNGAAIISVLSSVDKAPFENYDFVMYFVYGVIAAFFAGVFSWLLSDTMAMSIRRNLNIRLFAGEKLLASKSMHSSFVTFAILLFLCSAASLAFFSFGCYDAFENFKPTVVNQDGPLAAEPEGVAT